MSRLEQELSRLNNKLTIARIAALAACCVFIAINRKELFWGWLVGSVLLAIFFHYDGKRSARLYAERFDVEDGAKP